nr:lysophospholipase [Bradyrhizobium sp. DOA9]
MDSLVAGGSLAEPAAPRHFTARDGAIRPYRLYPGSGCDVLIFLHGSSSDGRYLAGLASDVAASTGLTVVTPDMRGHGSKPGRRGDVDAIDRQEQDIGDLITMLRDEGSYGRFLLGGHSIGAGLAIRYAAGREQPKPAGMVLIAPYIHRKSPGARPNSGGWATPFVPRFAGIAMLQRFGIHLFDRLPVLRFAVPPAARDGTETALYSWRLFASVTPRSDWRNDIRSIACPVLVLAAARDSIFRSEGYREVFEPLRHASVEIIPAIDHFQLVTSSDVPRRIAHWLNAVVPGTVAKAGGLANAKMES